MSRHVVKLEACGFSGVFYREAHQPWVGADSSEALLWVRQIHLDGLLRTLPNVSGAARDQSVLHFLACEILDRIQIAELGAVSSGCGPLLAYYLRLCEQLADLGDTRYMRAMAVATAWSSPNTEPVESGADVEALLTQAEAGYRIALNTLADAEREVEEYGLAREPQLHAARTLVLSASIGVRAARALSLRFEESQ